jgi:divalent metal cation (Fe/Co/Zn/Cd) transporter
MGDAAMRSGKRGRRNNRVVMILTIAAALALAIIGGSAAMAAEVIWTIGDTVASVAVVGK